MIMVKYILIEKCVKTKELFSLLVLTNGQLINEISSQNIPTSRPLAQVFFQILEQGFLHPKTGYTFRYLLRIFRIENLEKTAKLKGHKFDNINSCANYIYIYIYERLDI